MTVAPIIDQLGTYGPEACERLTYEQASAYAKEVTEAHSENFTVVSRLLPHRLRDDFRHVYAFCRWADDLGDEAGDPERALSLLNWWRDELDRCYAGDPRHPVFVALARTIEKHEIPRQPFADLIDAFEQDQRVQRYEDWDQVVDYCTRSANPVGRLVLYLAGHRDPERQALADQTCTALQLANFWQDVRRDVIERDRIYIPGKIARAHGLDLGTMARIIKAQAGVHEHSHMHECGDDHAHGGCGCSHVPPVGISAIMPAYKATLGELVQRTAPMFEEGRKLWPMLDPDIRLDVKLFTLGGEAVLGAIRRRGYDTLTTRPRIGKRTKAMLGARAVLGMVGRGSRAGRGGRSSRGSVGLQGEVA